MREMLNGVKAAVPRPATRAINRGLEGVKLAKFKAYRMPTRHVRALPDFIIIGAQKCGTSSLYNYLTQHPHVARAFRKEIYFFDRHLGEGLDWYRAHFPLRFYKRLRRRLGRDALTGEATPNYILSAQAAEQIAATLPAVKLIAVLRNPVDRAYSGYHHAVRLGVERFSFEEAVLCEGERLRQADEGTASYYSYLARGLYAEQLEPWLRLFSREQFLILRSERLDADPAATVRQVFEFLGLPNANGIAYHRYHAGRYAGMDAATRSRLLDYFAPHNQRLYELLGARFHWDR